jgi:cytochrome c biogenesis factor
MAWKPKSIAPIVSWPWADRKSDELLAGAGLMDWLLFAVLAVGIVTLAVALAASDFGEATRLFY